MTKRRRPWPPHRYPYVKGDEKLPKMRNRSRRAKGKFRVKYGLWGHVR